MCRMQGRVYADRRRHADLEQLHAELREPARVALGGELLQLRVGQWPVRPLAATGVRPVLALARIAHAELSIEDGNRRAGEGGRRRAGRREYG